MLLKILLNGFSRKHGTALPGKWGSMFKVKNLKICLDICLILDVKMLIIQLFLLDIYSLANNKLQ
jgi:hypothetical protein